MKIIFAFLFILLAAGYSRGESSLFPQYSDRMLSDYVCSTKELNQWKYLRSHGDSVKGHWIHWVLRVMSVEAEGAHPHLSTYMYFKNFKSGGCCRKVLLTSPWLDKKNVKDVLLKEGDIFAIDGQFKGLDKSGEIRIEGLTWKVIDTYKGK